VLNPAIRIRPPKNQPAQPTGSGQGQWGAPTDNPWAQQPTQAAQNQQPTQQAPAQKPAAADPWVIGNTTGTNPPF
jgi:single-strand DNA-binding protein